MKNYSDVKSQPRFKDTVSEVPKLCPYNRHDIQLTTGTTPIRQPANRLGPRKKIMQEEVDHLPQQGFAVPSSSPWASPILVVPSGLHQPQSSKISRKRLTHQSTTPKMVSSSPTLHPGIRLVKGFENILAATLSKSPFSCFR
ncbi:hypothetical protein SK128_002764 [Halocaridina rubra]|uniref:Uncharacterized protein n=1 Tax=Halocaridina rubra TaxID=373956 RepID=A0AAN8WZQ4_HALRR